MISLVQRHLSGRSVCRVQAFFVLFRCFLKPPWGGWLQWRLHLFAQTYWWKFSCIKVYANVLFLGTSWIFPVAFSAISMGKDFQIETWFLPVFGRWRPFLGFFRMVGSCDEWHWSTFHVIIGYGNSYFFFVYIHFKIRITWANDRDALMQRPLPVW